MEAKKWIWLTLFAMSMGFMESAVVVYLRELYYPDGFTFPLRTIPSGIAGVEIAREAATTIMLVSAALLSGRNGRQVFALFIFLFAIWDLVYYLGLYVSIGWPEGLLEWDVLFLIPVPWTGPVIAPCILSLLMIILAIVLLKENKLSPGKKFLVTERYGYITAALILIYGFMKDYLDHTGRTGNRQWIPGDDLFQELNEYTPGDFPWMIFFSGIAIILSLIIYRIVHVKKHICPK